MRATAGTWQTPPRNPNRLPFFSAKVAVVAICSGQEELPQFNERRRAPSKGPRIDPTPCRSARNCRPAPQAAACKTGSGRTRFSMALWLRRRATSRS